MARTILPTKIKRVLQFVKNKSDKNYGSWIYIPMYTADEYKVFRLCPIRDYLYFRIACKMGLIHMKYNESNAMLTLQGKKALEVV